MRKEQLAAQSIACWMTSPDANGRDLLREALPSIDVDWLFKALAKSSAFNATSVSLAIAGFGLSAVDLEAVHKASGLSELRGLTDDLHVAAEWRDRRDEHPIIVSLAKGRHPGVSTLDHFAAASSRDLTRILLDWAESESGLPVNDLQSELLRALASDDIIGLVSLDAVCNFLAEWFASKHEDALGAPRAALPYLGLIADPALFSKSGGIMERLLENFKVTSQVKDAPASSLRAVERRLSQRFRNDLATRDRLLGVCARLAKMRLYSGVMEMAGVTLDETKQVLRPPGDSLPDPLSVVPEDDNPQEEEATAGVPEKGAGGWRELAKASGDDLLDDNQERLTRRIMSVESALEAAIAEDEKRFEAEVEIQGNEVRVSIELDHGLLDWLHTFCNSEVFGGLLFTREPSIAEAIKQHESCQSYRVEPNRIAVLDGQQMDLRKVFADWEVQLARRGHHVNILSDWDAFVIDREVLVEHLDVLFQLPLDWMAGHPEMAAVVERYLNTATRLYCQVQSNFRNMCEVDQGWAEIGLHGLLALDVMQVRCFLEDDLESWKAVLLPTHPLHLWRYQRLTAVLRGLGTVLDSEDREAVIGECLRPDQFLSVLYTSALPDNKGGARLLPISSDLHGLATFENLQNACSGMDGVNTLRYILDRFVAANRIHLRPLRVGILNPPDAPKLLVELAKILNERRESTLPTMRVELFSTTAPAVRGRAALALAFSPETMDLIEDRLASGRMELQIHEQAQPLEEWISHWGREPMHLLVMFDEAGVAIRRSDMGLPMPMSPFCVRKVIRYQELRGTLRLDPTTDEPPFSEYMQLMNEADRGQRDSTPSAWADAENLRQVVDLVLQGEHFCAFWLALADRALPAETGLASVRLLARREGQRELLLLSRDYRRLGALVRPAFSRWHLHVTTDQLCKLLEEGVHLSGAGILNLVKRDGTVDANQVLGTAGALLAARDYVQRHPGALVVSIDHQIARHWLRLGKRNERCDLIALRQEEDGLVLEAIEVKSTHTTVADIPPAVREQAAIQLSSTLEALADGLAGSWPEAGPLSVPRCEMLKEVLVRGCLGKHVSPQQRGIWCGWLKRIFGQDGDPLPVKLCGEIILVAVGESQTVPPQAVIDSDPPVVIRTLGESEVQRLLEADGSDNPPPSDQGTSVYSELPILPALGPSVPPGTLVAGSLTTMRTKVPPFRPVTSSKELRSITAQPAEKSETPPIDWPPQPNELGMIGQDETVSELINRLCFARDFNQRFKDTMFVGSAGVGKSSFARAIADQLLGQAPIIFSGADLRIGRMIIEKLQTEGKVPDDAGRPVRLHPCVIFIDEVHALSSTVANTLLSVLDDARLTTIDNVGYDFADVVFLMATTDAGKLTEAFRSRPDRVLLRNYTLDEVAGILWLHGKRELDDFSLPYEVCLEIAARTRAYPRVAVRMLTNQLVPHFHAQVRSTGVGPNKYLIGQAMGVEAVAMYFESQGIDANGIDHIARNFLSYLALHGATAEERIRQGLGISNRGDFVESDEYLQRLGLVTVRGGRTLTRDGRRYLQAAFDLRQRISRQS